MRTNPEWTYVSSTGVICTGYMRSFADRGGTDVTYFMQRVTPNVELDLLSGERLRKARTTGAVVPLVAADQAKFK